MPEKSLQLRLLSNLRHGSPAEEHPERGTQQPGPSPRPRRVHRLQLTSETSLLGSGPLDADRQRVSRGLELCDLVLHPAPVCERRLEVDRLPHEPAADLSLEIVSDLNLLLEPGHFCLESSHLDRPLPFVSKAFVRQAQRFLQGLPQLPAKPTDFLEHLNPRPFAPIAFFCEALQVCACAFDLLADLPPFRDRLLASLVDTSSIFGRKIGLDACRLVERHARGVVNEALASAEFVVLNVPP
jgi:hypothetical protein